MKLLKKIHSLIKKLWGYVTKQNKKENKEMIKNKTILEVKIGERAYQMECYPDSPLGEIFDALCAMRGFIVQRMIEEQEKDKKVVEKPKEE